MCRKRPDPQMYQICDGHKNANKLIAKPFFKTECQIYDTDGQYQGSEITSLKKTIVDDKPVHFGVCILQNSKLLLLR